MIILLLLMLLVLARTLNMTQGSRSWVLAIHLLLSPSCHHFALGSLLQRSSPYSIVVIKVGKRDMLETSGLCHLLPAVLLGVTSKLNSDLLAITSNHRDLHWLLGLGITHCLHLGLPLFSKSLSHLLLGFSLQSLHLLMLLEFLLIRGLGITHCLHL